MSFLSLHHSHPPTPTPADFSSSNNIVLENAVPDKTVEESSQDLYTPSSFSFLVHTLSVHNRP